MGATGNQEVLACGLTDETQMCFPVQCLPWFVLFPSYVQVHRIQRMPGYEPPVQQDFILHNNCLRKGNRVSKAWFDVFLLKRTCVKLYLPYSFLRRTWIITFLEIVMTYTPPCPLVPVMFFQVLHSSKRANSVMIWKLFMEYVFLQC